MLIYEPEFCQTNFHDVYCSFFNTSASETCVATLGSPVLCDNKLFSAFLIQHEPCTPNMNGEIQLRYHSVDRYSKWIEEVFKSSDRKLSKKYIVNIIEFTSPDTTTVKFRCAGTVISEHHVLTTADCVTFDKGLTLGIEVQGYGIREFSMFYVWNFLLNFEILDNEVEVFINPITNRDRSENVAIVKVNEMISEKNESVSLHF